MKRFILLTATAFIASLLGTGMALGMSHEKMGGTEGAMEKKHEVSESVATHQLNQEQVRELQSILRDEGYEVGAIDGIIGPNTRSAIKEFQRDEGLAVTGETDEETLRALAPSSEQQEFFGLSPEFGEKEGEWEEKGMEEKTPMEGEPRKETPKSY